MIYKVKQNAKYICSFFVVILLVGVLINVAVFAESPYDYAKSKLTNPIKFGVFCMTFLSKMGPDMLGYMVAPWFESPIWNLRGEFGTIQTLISSIGKMICFLYFLLDLLEHATRDTFTAESFIKSFAKLIIMFVIFDPINMKELQWFGSDLNNGIVDAIAKGSYDNFQNNVRSYVDTLAKTSWIKCIGFLFESAVPGIAVLFATIVALFICAGRYLEIVVYTLFLPIGISSIYAGGINSPGFRYFKKLVALYIQGAVMAATLWALSQPFVRDSALLTQIPLIGDIILIFVGVGVIGKSKSIANDIVGV